VRYPTFERVGDGWRNWNGYGVNALDHLGRIAAVALHAPPVDAQIAFKSDYLPLERRARA